MPYVTCPDCGIESLAPRAMVGMRWPCPKCGAAISVTEDDEPVRSAPRARRAQRQPDLTRAVLVWSGIGAASLGLFGVLLSQFAPVFGGILALARPFSPARVSLIPIHLFVFALIGGIGGAGIVLLRDYSARRRR